jgi:hypothetical protein
MTNRNPPRPSEASLHLQADIEGLVSQQVQLKDALVTHAQLSIEEAAFIVEKIGIDAALVWKDVFDKATDKKIALQQLMDIEEQVAT